MEGIYILFSDNLRNLGHTLIKGVTKLESQNKVLLFGEWITKEQECSLGDLRSPRVASKQQFTHGTTTGSFSMKFCIFS